MIAPILYILGGSVVVILYHSVQTTVGLEYSLEVVGYICLSIHNWQLALASFLTGNQ